MCLSKEKLGLSVALMNVSHCNRVKNRQNTTNLFFYEVFYADLKVSNFGSKNFAAFYNLHSVGKLL